MIEQQEEVQQQEEEHAIQQNIIKDQIYITCDQSTLTIPISIESISNSIAITVKNQDLYVFKKKKTKNILH